MGMIFFKSVDITGVLKRYEIELKSILKNPAAFTKNHHDYSIKCC